MDYKKIYDALILKAQNEHREKWQGTYYERHHITPRCVGGSNLKDNKVLLTAREHFVAHKLLVYIYPNNIGIIAAFGMMAHVTYKGRRSDMKISSRDYELIRTLIATTPITEERRKKLIDSHKGIPSPRKGIPLTHDHNEKNRLGHIGIFPTQEDLEKRRKSMMGKNNKPILQFDKEGVFIKEWHSTNEASRELGIGDSGIWKAMNGERKYFGGFIWKYK